MPTLESVDWYDLPRYYDLIFGPETELECTFLEAVAAVHGRGLARGRRRVLEPACGSGRLITALAERGWRVTGTDLSAPMLDYARGQLRARGLRARLAQADMAEPPPGGPFDLAHCLVSTFKYLLSEAAAVAHLRGVAQALAPGGLYVLGFHLTDYGRTSKERERWVVEQGGTHVVCNIQGCPPDRRRRRERVRSRLVVTEDGEVRRTETTWEFRTYDAAQTRRLLAQVPALELVAVHDFHYELDEPLVLDDDRFDTVLILRKR